MKLTFLGTSAVFPTKERNHSAVALSYSGEILLFDCGEATQRQITFSELSPMKISKIFITHWHGDHTFGLPGLIESLQMNRRSAELNVYGPKGTKENFKTMLKAFEMYPEYKINVHEVDPKSPTKICDEENYEVFALRVKHTVPCISFYFKEKDKIRINTDYTEKFGLKEDPILRELQASKDIVWQGKKIRAEDATTITLGKKITYIVDTYYDESLVDFAKDSDVLVCEATFMHNLSEQAKEKGHMTSRLAGKLAKKAHAKQLIITHFSQRYKSVSELLAETRKVFENTSAAHDLMNVKF